MSSDAKTSHSELCTNQKLVAKSRWKILARSIVTINCDHQAITLEQDSSTGYFRSFDLIKFKPLENTAFGSLVELFQCTTTLKKETFFVRIQIPRKPFTLANIAGFNNTGNVCVWPTEEVMAYYVMSNLKKFHGKRVLELGGGMTCLAGLMVAKYSSAVKVHLTDGNTSSIENVGKVIDMNDLDHTRVSCSVLEWDKARRDTGTYDVVLSADCLFFDEARSDLVEAMWTLLADDGLAIVMAPLRGDTFHKFLVLAETRGFHCVTRRNYNDLVWSQHLLLKEKSEYTENDHYPILIELSK